MSRRPSLALLLALVAIAFVAQGGVAEGEDVLDVARSRLVGRIDARTSERADSFSLRATVPESIDLGAFDPATESLRVTVAGVAVIETTAVDDADRFRARRRRGKVVRWRYRSDGTADGAGLRVVRAAIRRGRLRVRMRHADLTVVLARVTGSAPLELRLGDAIASTTIPYHETSADHWRYRRPPPHAQGPVGPVRWTVVASGSLVETPRPTLEAARDDVELAALWSTLGSPGPLPVVDFRVDMIVVVSALVMGPGAFPPVVDVTGARAAGDALRIDWRLAGCDWNLCPAAPEPVTCPTVTPFKVVHVTRSAAVKHVQGSTLGVCP